MKKLPLLISLLFSAAISIASAAAPANDNFENATVLPSQNAVSINGSTIGGTSQTGDPFGSKSVWYAWTAPATGIVSMSATPSPSFVLDDLFASVMVGETLLSAVLVNNGEITDDVFRFYTVAGQNYKICIGNWSSGQQENFSLGIAYTSTISEKTQFYTPLINDNFSDALVLNQSSFNMVLNTLNATYEPFETDKLDSVGATYSRYGGIWLKWTAPVTGKATFQAKTILSDNVLLLVGIGSNIPSYDIITGNYSGMIFDCKKDVQYTLYVNYGRSQILASMTTAATPNVGPVTRIKSPVNNATISKKGVSVVPVGADVDGIRRYELRVNGQFIAYDVPGGKTFATKALKGKTAKIQVRAQDKLGAWGAFQTIKVKVE